jgi:hypothetical protein
MGFICNFCAKAQPAGTAAHKVVTQYRMFQHPVRPKAMVKVIEKNGKKKKEWVTDPGGVGLQIVQEVLTCPQCAADWDRQLRQRQGSLPEGQSAKPILPLVKPVAKEITPERRPFQRGGYRKPPEGVTAGGTQERSFRPAPHQAQRPAYRPRPQQ